VTDDAPETVPTAAEILTMPTETPRTRPFPSTVAVAGVALVHWNGTPVIAVFAASRATAVSCRV